VKRSMAEMENNNIDQKFTAVVDPSESKLLNGESKTVTRTDYKNNNINDEEKHLHVKDSSTTYFETIVHLFKGNIGSGLFAMGDAFRNAGIAVGTVFTIVLGITCLHSQRQLVKCSKLMQERCNTIKAPGYAETVELCFIHGPKSFRRYSDIARRSVNAFICLTQLGFCCIYFVFISASLKQVFDHYGIYISTQAYMVIIMIPIIVTCMVTNLKYLVPFSSLATCCMATGIVLVLYYSCQDLPPITDRKMFSSLQQLPIYFGTAIFCFEGIALVLPLKNSMRNPKDFDRPLGVLNVGTLLVISIFTTFGFIGYLRYGDDVKGSISLNLPEDEILAQVVKLSTSLGVLLGFALQFYIAIEIMWPEMVKRLGLEKSLKQKELSFRVLMVIATFIVAELIPNLVLLISLIGAFCSSALALMYPPLIELLVVFSNEKKPNRFLVIKNVTIIMIGVLGFLTGTYESILAIFKEFTQ